MCMRGQAPSKSREASRSAQTLRLGTYSTKRLFDLRRLFISGMCLREQGWSLDSLHSLCTQTLIQTREVKLTLKCTHICHCIKSRHDDTSARCLRDKVCMRRPARAAREVYPPWIVVHSDCRIRVSSKATLSHPLSEPLAAAAASTSSGHDKTMARHRCVLCSCQASMQL